MISTNFIFVDERFWNNCKSSNGEHTVYFDYVRHLKLLIMLKYVGKNVDVIEMFYYKSVMINFNNHNWQYVIVEYDDFIIDV